MPAPNFSWFWKSGYVANFIFPGMELPIKITVKPFTWPIAKLNSACAALLVMIC